MATLRLITLPIGNIGDLSERAKEALLHETYFLAEDTRELKKLLGQLSIDFTSKKIECFNDHSDSRISNYLLKMDSGLDINLVSDAGSPVISDPAFPLIRAVLKEGHELETLSGISAVTTALELSGLPPHPFSFYGFLPRENSKKIQTFKNDFQLKATHIYFDSPHRVEKTLDILKQYYPKLEVSVCREMTKKFESVYRFKAEDYLDQEINYKGEFVLVINNSNMSTSRKGDYSELEELATSYLGSGSKPKTLSKLLAKILDRDSKEIYNQLNRRV